MAVSRVTVLDERFRSSLRAMTAGSTRPLDAPVRTGSGLTGRALVSLLASQVESRHLDFTARWLKDQGYGFYTIGSSGHEGNAAVAHATRPSDPALLHYRSGAFFVHRARQVPGQTPLLDVMLGCTAARDEPIAGGRHKVFGSAALAIPPQTSTIASHLPKAVGMAFALERARRLGVPSNAPPDAIVIATFGDASLNHASAQTALNAASYAAHRHQPLPLLLVCEDNGIGISVRTPPGWVEASLRGRPGIAYLRASGLDVIEAATVAQEAADLARRTRRPVVLHLGVVRLLGHAGSDVEQGYRTLAEIEATEALDPLVATARAVVEAGLMTPDGVLALYEDARERTLALAEEAARRPRLESAAQVVAKLAPRTPLAVAREATRELNEAERARFWEDRLPEDDKPRHLAVQLSRALGDLLVQHPEAVIFGEDVARKGGVYHVTADLWRRAGLGRVFDTLLDETTILGLAIGAGQMGLLPIAEIQYLAYLHNAEDQLRGEAASLQFFSQGAFRNPMVVRIPSYAYQKGFGGHFHNDNSVAVLRDVPGLVIASPSLPDDAVRMLRTCVAAARVDGAVCAFLEPIALYMTRDLYDTGDGLFTTLYPAPGKDDAHVPIGSGRTHGDGRDLTIVSHANGLRLSLRAARRLLTDHGVAARVLDLRWLAPLPVDDLLREARATGRVLVVDETRASGGVSEGVLTALIDGGFRGELRRVTSLDTFVPLGDAANRVLVQEPAIVREALALVGRS
jgi:2-oxoisovalerate dehydrogenase E1 component